MDGARTTATRTSPILPRDRASAGRAMGLFLTAGGLFGVIFGLAVPGFAGHGAVLAVVPGRLPGSRRAPGSRA